MQFSNINIFVLKNHNYHNIFFIYFPLVAKIPTMALPKDTIPNIPVIKKNILEYHLYSLRHVHRISNSYQLLHQKWLTDSLWKEEYSHHSFDDLYIYSSLPHNSVYTLTHFTCVYHISYFWKTKDCIIISTVLFESIVFYQYFCIYIVLIFIYWNIL